MSLTDFKNYCLRNSVPYGSRNSLFLALSEREQKVREMAMEKLRAVARNPRAYGFCESKLELFHFVSVPEDWSVHNVVEGVLFGDDEVYLGKVAHVHPVRDDFHLVGAYRFVRSEFDVSSMRVSVLGKGPLNRTAVKIFQPRVFELFGRGDKYDDALGTFV